MAITEEWIEAPMNRPPSQIGMVAALGNDQAQEFSHHLVSWLEDRKRTVTSEEELKSGAIVDVLIVLGGDGLMMHMAHTFPGIPILGINFGTVGFLAMVERAQWSPVLEKILAGQYEIQNGPTLQMSHLRGNTEVLNKVAINDVVVRAGLRMIDVELYVDGQYVNIYPGDGMIIASPQGSTAYCMAAGGPILTAGVTGFAVTPIAPHSPIRSTLVVPETCTIEIVLVNERDADLIVDGVAAGKLRRGDVLSVTRGEIPFKLIRVEDMNFYEAFRSKFNYLIRPGAVPSLGNDRSHG